MNNDPFREIERKGRVLIGCAIFAVLIKLAIVGAIIYAAVHFIQKYW